MLCRRCLLFAARPLWARRRDWSRLQGADLQQVLSRVDMLRHEACELLPQLPDAPGGGQPRPLLICRASAHFSWPGHPLKRLHRCCMELYERARKRCRPCSWSLHASRSKCSRTHTDGRLFNLEAAPVWEVLADWWLAALAMRASVSVGSLALGLAAGWLGAPSVRYCLPLHCHTCHNKPGEHLGQNPVPTIYACTQQ